MGKFVLLKNIFLILFIIGVVYMFANYAEPVKNMAFGILHVPSNNVLGASSLRAGEFSQNVKSDIDKTAENLQKQILNITVGDIFGVLGRAQRIPQDIKTAGDFIKEQADNVLQSKK